MFSNKIWTLIFKQFKSKTQPGYFVFRPDIRKGIKYLQAKKFEMRDEKYKCFNKKQLDQALSNFPKVFETFRNDFNDCDDFADHFSSLFRMKYPGIAVGTIDVLTPKYAHRLNVLWTADTSVYIFEPQTMTLYTPQKYKSLFKVQQVRDLQI